MINLLPPEGKKRVLTNYWIRVASVFLVLIGCSFLITTALLLPTYFYLSFQGNALSRNFTTVEAGSETYATLEKEINLANDISDVLLDEKIYIDVTEVTDQVMGFTSDKISISSVSISKTDGYISEVRVIGRAADRSSLLGFRDTVEAHELFSEVDLPLSDLAKDQDIPFSLKLEPSDLMKTPL